MDVALQRKCCLMRSDGEVVPLGDMKFLFSLFRSEVWWGGGVEREGGGGQGDM